MIRTYPRRPCRGTTSDSSPTYGSVDPLVLFPDLGVVTFLEWGVGDGVGWDEETSVCVCVSGRDRDGRCTGVKKT